jgi:hypothetical protein
LEGWVQEAALERRVQDTAEDAPVGILEQFEEDVAGGIEEDGNRGPGQRIKGDRDQVPERITPHREGATEGINEDEPVRPPHQAQAPVSLPGMGGCRRQHACHAEFRRMLPRRLLPGSRPGEVKGSQQPQRAGCRPAGMLSIHNSHL